MSKLIDIERKGNVIRLYFGEDNLKEWWGDDWNDCPFELNAGTVYDRFVKGTIDVYFDFETLVEEPTSNGYMSNEYCKDDMIKRYVPCLMFTKEKEIEEYGYIRLKNLIGNDKIKKLYYGDSESKVIKEIEESGGKVIKRCL